MKSRGAPALSGRWLVLEISVWRLCLVVGKGKKAAGWQLPPQLQLLQPPLIVIIPITPLLNCGGNDSCSIPYKARRNPTAVQAMTSFLFISSWNQRWIGWNDRMQNCINGEQRVSDEDKLSKSFFYRPLKSSPHLFLVLFQVRGSLSCLFFLQFSCIQQRLESLRCLSLSTEVAVWTMSFVTSKQLQSLSCPDVCFYLSSRRLALLVLSQQRLMRLNWWYCSTCSFIMSLLLVLLTVSDSFFHKQAA